MRFLYRKYHFLENSKNLILVKKFFLAKQKNTCLFIVDNEPKENYLVQICNIDCQSNMEWPIHIFRKLWFSVFVAIYVWIKSKVLDTDLWNFYHFFFVILSIVLGMKSTLGKKITIKFFFIVWEIFIHFFILFSL